VAGETKVFLATVYPNPVQDKNIHLRLSQAAARLDWQLTNSAGQIVGRGTKTNVVALTELNLGANRNLLAGTYQLKLIADQNEPISLSVVVQ
jgi:hypothetical protein